MGPRCCCKTAACTARPSKTFYTGRPRNAVTALGIVVLAQRLSNKLLKNIIDRVVYVGRGLNLIEAWPVEAKPVLGRRKKVRMSLIAELDNTIGSLTENMRSAHLRPPSAKCYKSTENQTEVNLLRNRRQLGAGALDAFRCGKPAAGLRRSLTNPATATTGKNNRHSSHILLGLSG